ncbi:ARM repeat-containing protein [Rhizodiscina lignyota]|uniref:ARM repeat-containing protein n=1 Tax=Rhizodiscina lignyota TaxID=1504668 RepID=A0A9P4I4R3_9PEZI|nr:ARM repeat-containing protein [Rhizodiscina lignyota]
MIEAPAEVNPLTDRILYNVLVSASSSDPNQIQTGTKQLQQWETQKGYYSLLQAVFLDKSLPLEVRYLAIIQLKNGIDKYWRKTATNAVDKEDRIQIRSRLLEAGVNEADTRLALQNALLTAKIVRFEYPNDWPDAITNLVDILRSSVSPNANRLHLPRALLMLLHVIKELATGRLQRTRTSLQAVTPEIFHVLGRIYFDRVQQWLAFLQGGGDDEGRAFESIQESLLAIKVIRRLLIAGYEFPNRDKDVHEFWRLVRNQFGDLLSIASNEQSTISPEVIRLVQKHLVQLAKLHLNMAKTHPAAFVLLPDSLDLVRAYWGLISKFGETFGSKSPIASAKIGNDGDADEDEKPLMEQLALKGLLIIRACVKMVFHPAQTFKYRHEQEKEERKQAIEAVKTQLFTDSLVREMTDVVVTRFFVFRASDLREWEEEPEEWERMQDGEGETFEFSVRPCAEKLFLDLAINYKMLVVEPLLNIFNIVATPANEDVLLKDSVYTALGLAAAVIHSQIDFDGFISATLVPEVQKQVPGYNILRRRIAIVLGQWISVKVSDQSKPLVYQIFQHLLNKDDPLNDQVVRVTAGRHFKHIADDWEFKAENFMPYASDTLSQLMALIEEVDLSETKLALLNTISVIVERLEHNITPYAERIVSLLPPLWEQSGEEHLMKQSILTILARLINAMKAESRPYHPLVLPIIKGAVEPGSETQVYLLDDALDLWHAVLVQTPDNSASADLLSLSNYLIPIFALGTETLRRTIEITESYLLLSPSTILAPDFRREFLRVVTDLMGNLKAEASGYLTNLIEMVVRATEGLGGEDGVRVLVGEMALAGFFLRLLNEDGLRGSWIAHQTTGPKSFDALVDGVVETDYFSVLARVGFASPSILLEAVAQVNAAESDTIEGEMKWLLEEWFSHFENIGDPGRRKLMALALTRLLEGGAPWMLGKLHDLIIIWTDMVMELTEGVEDKSIDSLVWTSPPIPEDSVFGPPAPEDGRRTQLSATDPIHTVNLITFVRERLQQAVAICGGEKVFQEEWLANVDQDVIKAFGHTGIV